MYSTNNMDDLITACCEYADNDKYVFKSCNNYIVVLEKLEDTVTNESRTNIVDPKCAKYRANKLKILLIIHKFYPLNIITEIQNSSYKEKKIVYITNEIIEIDDYDYNLNEVCTRGIHYFKTIEQAFFWELLKFNPKYTGKLNVWYDNGNKWREVEYKEGILEGKWIIWHENGNKMSEGDYKEGELDGKYIEWHENGNKSSEREYKKGKLEGKWIQWHENGNKSSEGEYKKGRQEGIWIEWYENGNKRREREYIAIEQAFFRELLKFNPKYTGKLNAWYENGNKWREVEYKKGKLEGKWIQWHENGNKSSEGEYKKGKQEGKWLEWYPNGNKMSEGEYKEGMLEGKWIEWRKNGNKMSEEEYKEGTLEGKMD